eukprot:gnl/MRDRNA2_/MRDRNA2_67386_c0_seq2.p1 gnl/MRDRNA2_/MRDRNA2_67386_c0~~gnl/MRDRNA2_/MRDRNA2_67386_c0_seq2.p1  ORF type:complete len:164 (-),score=19.49 gnl/MRDRNA2_/MRDRNA2_67386_c0_seq2:32-523(-)
MLNPFHQNLGWLKARGWQSSNRARLLRGNISNSEGPLLAKLKHYGPYDVVIDDASHFADHYIAAFKSIFVDDYLLQPGGIYIIEDAFNNIELHERQATGRHPTLEFFESVIANHMQFKINGHLHANLYIQSADIPLLRTWVEAVTFRRNMIFIRKRGGVSVRP